MKTKDTKVARVATALGLIGAMWMLTAGLALAAPAPDSKRLGHAKDLIADEQWTRAIAELQAAVDDPKETNRDEALFWLAHSQHQTGEDDAALQTIARLERTAPTSRWVHPARSLRIEIAQRLRRDDVLWRAAGPPPPPAPLAPPAPTAARPARPAAIAPPPPAAATASTHPPLPRPAAAAPPSAPAPPTPVALPLQPTPLPPVPPGFTEFWQPAQPAPPDMTLKLQALTGLLEAHSAEVIPLLRQIALDANTPDEARQAVFVLGQSRTPAAERTVIEVARDGAEPVRIAAVRELARFDGPTVSTELMRVYAMNGTPRLRRQIVNSLGERADNASLLHIARSDPEATVRDYAIVTLGRTGARDHLHTLYAQAPGGSRPAVLTALFTARDDDELIRIAQTETSPLLRLRARQLLRILATPKAIKFLEENR